MTEPSNGNGARELREAQKAAGDLFLASHLEKHDLEQRAADVSTELHSGKHKDEQKAVVAALEAERQRDEDHRVAHAAAHDSHEKLHDAFSDAHKQQHASEERAVAAAVMAMDRRLDEMNAFRDSLRDQAGTFIRRDQLEVFITAYERAHDEVVKGIATEREERRAQESAHALIHRGEEGQKRGITQSTAFIITAIGVVGTIITIVIVIANFATGMP